MFLADDDFRDLMGGRIVNGHRLFPDLQRKGFLRDGLDLDAFADRMARRNRLIGRGPHLHVLNLTQRCNQGCAYCAPATAANGTTLSDMSRETAEQAVRLALESTS